MTNGDKTTTPTDGEMRELTERAPRRGPWIERSGEIEGVTYKDGKKVDEELFNEAARLWIPTALERLAIITAEKEAVVPWNGLQVGQ